MKKKRVLVYPCGTEIGLEIYRALRYSTHYEVVGGVDNYDHGVFVFDKIVEGLPFIKDDSNETDVLSFEKAISNYNIDLIYPAMDGVIAVFAKYRDLIKETLIIPDTDTALMCRSKKMTYSKLESVISVPKVFQSVEDVTEFPVFIKPDQGQGSVGARKIENSEELESIDFDKFVVMEYLPGKEYTVDCFTNAEGKLVFAKGRSRKRIKNGISVNAVFDDDSRFIEIAEKINVAICQKGGWFFQLKEDKNGQLRLLEVAARIAGTSAISRNIGANLPLMSVDVYCGVPINDVALNDYFIELDRALDNAFKTDISYSTVYIDYDDTIVQRGLVNTNVIKFLYQCVNNGVKIIMLSKHDGNLDEELEKYRIVGLFDEIVHIKRSEKKTDFIDRGDSIFVDDSFGERNAVKKELGIPVFDTHMLECLIKE